MPAPWAAIAAVRIHGRVSGQLYNNVIHFATNTVINDPQTLEQLLRDLANAVRDCIMQFLIPASTSDFTFDNVEAFRIHPDPSDPFSADNVVPTLGDLGAQGIGFCSQLVQKRTGTGGRSGRGRIFLPPGPEDQVAAGDWSPAQLALVAAFCACMAGKFIGGSATTVWRLGVFSKKKVGDPPVPQDPDAAFREVLTLTPVAIAAKIGSRKKGKGA